MSSLESVSSGCNTQSENIQDERIKVEHEVQEK